MDRGELRFSTVSGAGGVPLSVIEAGAERGPAILFVHGFSQSYLSWTEQLHDPELQRHFHLIALDLRGHGSSGKPSDPAAYRAEAWADDLQAVISATGHRRPLLVSWSMGGTISFDYLLRHGTGEIAGLGMVAAATGLGGPTWPMNPGDPAMAQLMKAAGKMQSNDILENLEGCRAFVDLLTAKPLPAAERETIVIYNMLTPAYARALMFEGPRPDYLSLRGRIEVPVLLTHGDLDRIVPYHTSTATLPELPDGTLSTYHGIGHAPFLEDAPRFNAELAAFVTRVNS
jgi:pimeloyl-ACP methyl ester carboxylesterase